MTDADLARWEALSHDYWWAGRNLEVAEYEVMPTVVPALIAEVRRLRADLTHERLASRGLIARIAVLEGQNVLPPTPRPHPYEERRHTRN